MVSKGYRSSLVFVPGSLFIFTHCMSCFFPKGSSQCTGQCLSQTIGADILPVWLQAGGCRRGFRRCQISSWNVPRAAKPYHQQEHQAGGSGKPVPPGGSGPSGTGENQGRAVLHWGHRWKEGEKEGLYLLYPGTPICNLCKLCVSNIADVLESCTK